MKALQNKQEARSARNKNVRWWERQTYQVNSSTHSRMTRKNEAVFLIQLRIEKKTFQFLLVNGCSKKIIILIQKSYKYSSCLFTIIFTRSSNHSNFFITEKRKMFSFFASFVMAFQIVDAVHHKDPRIEKIVNDVMTRKSWTTFYLDSCFSFLWQRFWSFYLLFSYTQAQPNTFL